MHQKEINALRLFEALTSTENQSQRQIASNLKISLGLVNALIKSFVRKSYFEINPKPESTPKYLITPAGVAERSRLNYKYIHHAIELYKEIQKRIDNLFSTLNFNGKNQVVLYGSGELSIMVRDRMKEHNITLLSIVDNEKKLINLDFDVILIIELESVISIVQGLEKVGIAKEKILTL